MCIILLLNHRSCGVVRLMYAYYYIIQIRDQNCHAYATVVWKELNFFLILL
jgi:hypothetical protein